MNTILQDGARAAIWCEPVQQRSHVIALARLTPDSGSFQTANVLWSAVPLPGSGIPNDRSFYHVFQIGQVPPDLLNWVFTLGQWVSAVDMCQSQNAVITVYLANGTVLPLGTVYLMQNYDRNLLVAVRIIPKLALGSTTYINNVTGQTLTRGVVISDEQVYLRTYSNDRFNSSTFRATAPSPTQGISAVTQTINSQADYIRFTAANASLAQKYAGIGAVVYYTNGFITTPPGAYRPALLGSTLTAFWDESVVRINYYPMQGLPSFTSTVDPYTSKYVLLADSTYNLIEYAGDIDFYLVSITNGVMQGVYIDRSIVGTVRNLTHNAYSIRAASILTLTTQHAFLADVNSLQIMAVVRDGGQNRGIPNTSNRIEELYQLSVAQIAQAMTGVNSLVPEWQAVNLEASSYCQLMSADDSAITLQLAENAYGYNAASRYANPVLQAVTVAGDHGQVTATLAQDILDLQHTTSWRSVYAYDVNGLLLGYSNDQGRSNLIELPVYPVIPTTAEMMPLLTSTTLDGAYNGMNVSDWGLIQYGFRAYACDAPGGVPDEIWTDITSASSPYYTVAANGSGVPTLSWNASALTAAGLYGAIRIANIIHLYTPPALEPGYPGYMVFSVESSVTWRGTLAMRPQRIPPAVVDVFMDGQSLVLGIDYYMNWPQICIVKRPTTTPDVTAILVRSYGNANPRTVHPYPPREVGFVKGGILSVDGTYNIRNDRNIRVVTNGLLQLPTAVRFEESGTGPLSIDGRPYAISDYLLPVEPYTDQSTNGWYNSAEDLDTRVENYLTSRIALTPPVFSAVINDRWVVFSPLLSCLIQQFELGNFLNHGELTRPYNNLDVAGWLAPFLWLLPYDPCHVGVDSNYAVIEPHQYITTVQVTQPQWVFLEYVIANYLSNATQLTPSVVIGP
jgi:hypothetical protein